MAGIGKPGIEIGNVSVTGVSLSDISLVVEVIVENGNPVGIPVQEIDFDVLGIVHGKERAIAHGYYGNRHIPPGKTTLGVPVTIRNSEMLGALRDLILERSIDLRISGSARIGIGILSYTLPISEERGIRI